MFDALADVLAISAPVLTPLDIVLAVVSVVSAAIEIAACPNAEVTPCTAFLLVTNAAVLTFSDFVAALLRVVCA